MYIYFFTNTSRIRIRGVSAAYRYRIRHPVRIRHQIGVSVFPSINAPTKCMTK
uniref:Uncharacterized protein n=1 Tax=Arundo donax TaxID=35708 RepID=A0A0A9G717_ARUDO